MSCSDGGSELAKDKELSDIGYRLSEGKVRVRQTQ